MTKGTIQNRESFLQHLTEKLGTKRQPVSAHPFVPINDLPQTQLADKTPEELLEIAKERVPKIHTQIIETTKEHLEQTLLELVKEFGDGNVLLPSDSRFADYSLNIFTETSETKVPFTRQFWKKGNEFRQENIQTAQEANTAIAFAEFLLAESGSVVVETSAGQGRSLHFLPKHYLSIVPMSKIVPRSTQVAAYYSDKQANGEKVGSAIHIISGPSNSGDIEMQLVVGLHGPLEVKYVVVKDM